VTYFLTPDPQSAATDTNCQRTMEHCCSRHTTLLHCHTVSWEETEFYARWCLVIALGTASNCRPCQGRPKCRRKMRHEKSPRGVGATYRWCLCL